MNPSTERARELVASLVGAGVRHVVLCPGSRSAPMAYAFYDLSRRLPTLLTVHVRHDERVAGFTALGIGRATGVPAAVVTTSGTAVANLHPAVLEAHHGGVPMLVLSADRPPRLRGTWANQTSDIQDEMFGAATRFTRTLTPEQSAPRWTSAAREAVVVASGGRSSIPQPVHLNVCFDDPLVPDGGDSPWQPLFAGTGAGTGAGAGASSDAPNMAEPARPLSPTARDDDARDDDARDDDAWDDALASGRTVVVAGDRAGPVARRLAERHGLPLLAEPTSGVRSGALAVGPYRLLLDQPDLGGQVERAIVFGRPTLSRPVTRLLARADVEVVQIVGFETDPGPERTDVRRVALRAVAQYLSIDSGPTDSAADRWLGSWRRAGLLGAQAVDSVLDGWPVLTGPLVAREVAAATGPADALVLAASNPVRDIDLAGHPWAWPVGAGLVHAGRGLSGIDGTMSTAIGLALASERSTRALVGDVAFLHDLGALVLGPDEARPDLTVIVVNDAGGGIFSLLEPGADAERDEDSAARFERVFGTPHAVDLAQVCSGLGIPHALVASAAGLRERLATPPRGLQVIEVRVDRADLRPLHDAIARNVASAVAATQG